MWFDCCWWWLLLSFICSRLCNIKAYNIRCCTFFFICMSPPCFFCLYNIVLYIIYYIWRLRKKGKFFMCFLYWADLLRLSCSFELKDNDDDNDWIIFVLLLLLLYSCLFFVGFLCLYLINVVFCVLFSVVF